MRVTLNDLEALTILAATPGIGPVRARQLLDRFGAPVDVLHIAADRLSALPGFGGKIPEAWGWWKRDATWKQNLDLAEREGVQILPYTHPSYPASLLQLPDAPVLLYVKGSLTALDRHAIAVVGTRAASVYGLEMGEKISQDLAAMKFAVISGLARGIDTAAHCGALKSGRTLAVIGSGLANIYPRENAALAERIAANGALISEFPMATPPDRENFPQRNRIVSGMSTGVLLIEAPEKSGAMITMDRAWTQGKKCFALPGRADGEYFRGNHALIKGGRAQLVENASDIAESFDLLFTGVPQPAAVPLKTPLGKEENDLLKKLPEEEISIEDIVELTHLPVMKLNILLMGLVLKRVLKEYPGKMYKRVTGS